MSKKHFRAIAEAIRECTFIDSNLNNCQTDTVMLVDKLSDYFKHDNPNFSFTRFHDAIFTGGDK